MSGRPVTRRLRLGLWLLGLLTAAVLAGPLLTANPTAIVDPRAASLLPPGSPRWILHLADGSTLAATAARREGDAWVIERLDRTRRVPGSEVRSVERRRFFLGTDTVGRDVLARLVAGGRVSLGIGAVALAVTLGIGVAAGLAAGLAGGLLDAVLMRLVDALLAIPMLFLLLLLTAVFRPGLTTLVLVLAASSWMGVARLVRGQVLSLKEREFILAARGIGAGSFRIAFAHLLPNTLGPLTQDAALRLGDLILVEASLSFLGLGVQPPVASWGSMVAEGEAVLTSAWWLTFLPGLAVAATVIGAALLADGLGSLARGERAAEA